jgi:hypothetical protein
MAVAKVSALEIGSRQEGLIQDNSFQHTPCHLYLGEGSGTGMISVLQFGESRHGKDEVDGTSSAGTVHNRCSRYIRVARVEGAHPAPYVDHAQKG